MGVGRSPKNLRDAGARPFAWDVVVPLETRCSITFAIVPNFVALGQTVILKIGYTDGGVLTGLSSID